MSETTLKLSCFFRSTSNQPEVCPSSKYQLDRKSPSFASSGPPVSGKELAGIGLPVARFRVVITTCSLSFATGPACLHALPISSNRLTTLGERRPSRVGG